MVYDPNTPENPSDSLPTSQPQLLANFLSLYNSFAVDHVALDATSDAGNHKVIHLLQQDNSPQVSAGSFAIYSKKVEGQTSQIFIRFQGNGKAIQLSNYQIYALEQGPFVYPYFTILPGGLIVYFGSIAMNPNQGIVQYIQLTPKICKNIITVQVCPVGSLLYLKPYIEIFPPTNGIYSDIILTYGPGFPANPSGQIINYCVIGNT